MQEKINRLATQGYEFQMELYFRHAFDLMKRVLPLVTMFTAIYLLIGLALAKNQIMIIAYEFIMSGPITVTFMHVFRKADLGQRVEVNDLLFGFQIITKSLVVRLLPIVLVFVGVFMLIVPGIYLAVALMFVVPFAIFDNMEIMTSIEASRRIITRKWWNFAIFGILLVAINLLGALFFGIGIIFTLPFINAAIYSAYRHVWVESDNIYQAEEEDFTKMFR